MIEEKFIQNIRTYGVYKGSGDKRSGVLFKDLGFVKDRKADYAIFSGCLQPEQMPNVFASIRKFLDRSHISYSFLSKEYCCGWVPFGQPAVMAKNEVDVARSKELAKGFILENFKQAEGLGANSVVTFCTACEAFYSSYKSATNLEVITYGQLMERYFSGGKLPIEADYYAGCYRFRRKITSSPMDIDQALKVLDKIEGLKLNPLDNNLCCHIPVQFENLINTLKTNILITPCTGCYHSFRRAFRDRGSYQVILLPEVVWRAVQG